MSWPTHTDYQDAIQNPDLCFQEQELKAGVPACDMLGLPRVTSGNFASVYELATAGGRWAVRCFVRQVSGQQGRYARLSQHLSGMQIESIVKFEYILKGILVRGDWYPMLKMEWVDGFPLNLYIEQHLGEPETMRKLAVDWRRLMASLRQNKLAHGDLQHGNVMVTRSGGELRLVDYDGMYAPVFGRGKSPELGHINFQHPRRTPDFYGENLDNFSALIIYISFLALAEDSSLFQQFYTGDNILFSSSDLKNPLQSGLFQKLKQNSNRDVVQLAALIEKCCIMPVENVPDFESVMKALDGGSLEALISGLATQPAKADYNLSYLGALPEETGNQKTRSSYDHVPVATPTQTHVFKKPGQTTPAMTTPHQQRQQAADSEDSAKFWRYATVALAALLFGALILFFLDRHDQGDDKITAPEETPAEETSTERDPPAGTVGSKN
jgi:hypothetical protein